MSALLSPPPAAPPPPAPKRRPPSEAERLSALVGQLMSLVTRRCAGDTLTILTESGLTMAQLVSLHFLEQTGARSVSAIAATLRLSPAATSHLVDRLVQAKLVERREDPDDRRAKRVAITPAGTALAARVQAERTREFGQVLGHLTPALRRRFAAVLTLVNRELASLSEETKPTSKEAKP
jgi:MarR family transcriptional regulator, organic hydroperoxide resistance regulator